MNGHAECLKLLLAAGGDINQGADSGEFEGAPPISVAAMNGHAECLKLLLAAGGDINKGADSGEFAARMAVLRFTVPLATATLSASSCCWLRAVM
jgi:ankyrin repeat protein